MNKLAIKEANDYFEYAAKQGFEYDLEGLSQEEICELAFKMMEAGDMAYENWKDEHPEIEYDENGCDPGGHPNSEVMAERLNI